MSRTVETDAYLKVECRRDGRGEVRSIGVVGVTQKAPRAGIGSIAVKVRLRVPVSVFGPYVPEAIVVLPEAPDGPVVVEGTIEGGEP